MSEEPKNCPFCGGKARYTHYINAINGGHVIHCDNFSMCLLLPKCGEDTEAEAIAAWNRRFVCPDKHGKPVYAGDKFNFLSNCDPPIKLHFAWSVPQLRYMYENERGDTWRPNSSDKIELIEESETTINEMTEILESLGWDYAESSDGTGDMFLYWDHTKKMPAWCPDTITSCECLETVWQWYRKRE